MLAAPDLPMLKDGCVEACPACPHRKWSTDESLRDKQEWAETKLAAWRTQILPILGPREDRRWHYRRKARLHAEWAGDRWQFGLLHREQLIPIPNCPLHDPAIGAVQARLREHLPGPERLPLAFFVQHGRQVCLVAKCKPRATDVWWTNEFRTSLAQVDVEALWLNWHPAAGNRVFNARGWQLMWGRPRSRDEQGLWHGPAGFHQLLPELSAAALRRVITHLKPDVNSAVVDLYSGIGASLRSWLERQATAIGVELDGEAVDCAERNAPGVKVLRGRCSQRIPQLQTWIDRARRDGRQVLMHLNPPRLGLEPEVLDWIAATARPSRMAYLSCSLGTLERDLRQLEAAGFEVTAIQPYDFMPQTRHTEALALLECKAETLTTRSRSI